MNERAIFLAALDLSPTDRAAFLAEKCGPDVDLWKRVDALFAAHAAAGDFLDPSVSPDGTRSFADAAPTRDPDGTRDRPGTPEAAGGVIAGRYKLLQQIGEGGMGAVWMADQTEPVKRRVAVKLIRAERGQSKTILARFEAERQAIALMDHPHIARLLDAGTTEAGAPFFVMELVKGIPLSDYCDQHRLTIAERLNLFTQICSAVQHAHQKGVIHRDLKPSNILVESHDGKPVPKVIDFGLAKATTGLQLTDQSMFTAFGSVMGTPLYMSPEQATFNAVDVDTRADVYALGVVLYELLTGSTPLTMETMKRAALDEMLKLIREQEAPTPSSRLSSADSTPSVAANRQIEPAKLGRFVKGELDWIVMKALSKERDRRYDTANGFARDIERFLNHEPVQAGPPSASYRLRKFVRRNRGQVIAASVVFLALVAGVVGTTVGLLEARRSADRERLAKLDAEDRRAEAEHAAAAEKAAKEAETVAKLEAERKRQEAERNLAFATKGNDILGSVFFELDPKKSYPTVGDFSQALTENLRKAVRELDGTAIGDPLVVAQMQHTLGVSLLALGDSASAITLFEKARDTRKEVLGPDDHATLASTSNLATAYRDAGQLDRALPLLEEAYRLTKGILGPKHADTLTSMNNLADAYRVAGKPKLSLSLSEEALEQVRKHLAPDDAVTIVTLNNLALAYQEAGKADKAVPLFAEAYKLQRAKHGPDHPSTFTSLHNLAVGHMLAGQPHKALPLYEDALKRRKARLGPDHPDTLTSMCSLADVYRMAGRLKEAVPLHEETLRLRKAKLGADHPDTLVSMNSLATAYKFADKLDLATPLMEQTLRVRKAKLGADHPDTLASMNNLATCYEEAGKLDLALPLYEETLERTKARRGADHPDTLSSMNNLGSGYIAAGKVDQALPLVEEAFRVQKAQRGADHPDTLNSMNNLAATYWRLRRLDQSVPLFEELVSQTQKKLGRSHPSTLMAVANLGVNYLGSRRAAEAIPLLEEAHRASKGYPPLRFVGTPLLTAYAAAGRPAEAAMLIDELLGDARKSLPKDSPQLAGMMAQFGMSLLEMRGYAEAEPLLRESVVTREKTQPDAWTTFNTYSLLGGAILGQKKYADAEPLLVKGYEGLKAREKTIPPQGSTRIPEALDRLIELYTATNKPDEAKKYQALRAAYRETLPPPRAVK